MCGVSSRRVAIVTGGARGIGAAITLRLLQDGYRVASVSRQDSALGNLSEMEPYVKDDYIHLCCDITHVSSIHRMIDSVVQAFGRIDVLVNNAGILTSSTVEETNEVEWSSVIGTNLTSPFFTIQAALPYLRKASAGRIINISSNAGRMGGVSNSVAYAASKGGLISLTYALAHRLARCGITVNCIAPGPVETEMFGSYSADDIQRVKSRIPIGRLGSPREIAAAVSYFSGEDSGSTTGAVLDINGGLFMG